MGRPVESQAFILSRRRRGPCSHEDRVCFSFSEQVGLVVFLELMDLRSSHLPWAWSLTQWGLLQTKPRVPHAGAPSTQGYSWLQAAKGYQAALSVFSWCWGGGGSFLLCEVGDILPLLSPASHTLPGEESTWRGASYSATLLPTALLPGALNPVTSR